MHSTALTGLKNVAFIACTDGIIIAFIAYTDGIISHYCCIKRELYLQMVL
jgi:hypothetical protein